MIAPGLSRFAIHPLLHDCPLAVISDDESMQIEVETILQRSAVHFGHQPADARKAQTVKTDSITEIGQFPRRKSRMPSPAATDMQAQLPRKGLKTALKRAKHAGG